MEYVIGALAGLLFGGVVGFLKEQLLWRRVSNNKNTEQMGSILSKTTISSLINVAALLAVYWPKDYFPFNAIAALVGTAVALSVCNHLFASRRR